MIVTEHRGWLVDRFPVPRARLILARRPVQQSAIDLRLQAWVPPRFAMMGWRQQPCEKIR